MLWYILSRKDWLIKKSFTFTFVIILNATAKIQPRHWGELLVEPPRKGTVFEGVALFPIMLHDEKCLNVLAFSSLNLLYVLPKLCKSAGIDTSQSTIDPLINNKLRSSRAANRFDCHHLHH